MENIQTIHVQTNEIFQFVSLEGYRQMVEDLSHFNQIFSTGKSYGIIGECGEGGWLLSNLLCGRCATTDSTIKINQNVAGRQLLQNIGWCIGDVDVSKTWYGKSLSVARLIQKGLEQSHRNIDIKEVIELFGLSDSRINMTLNELSWEKWRASIAIGYAFNKKVFCFPWGDTAFINDLILNVGIHRCLDILTKDGAMVILPTQREDSIDFLVDEIIYLNNPRHRPSPRAKEIVIEYKNSSDHI